MHSTTAGSCWCARSWMSAEVFGAIVDKHHASVARRVAEHWRLPPDAIDAVVGDVSEDRSTASLVRLAHVLVRRPQVEDVSEARRLDVQIDTGIGIFGLGCEELEALVPHAATESADARGLSGVELSPRVDRGSAA